MTEGSQVLLAVIGVLLTALTTLLLVQLQGIRSDVRAALKQQAEHQDDITKIKTVLRMNGCMEPDDETCSRKGDRG